MTIRRTESRSASPSRPRGGGGGRSAERRLGDFVLLDELGRGGMGVVYRARQESMSRDVALKVLPSFAGMEAESVARFKREAEAAGRLSHPSIVPVFAVGEDHGIHFYAMELVEGPSLEKLVAELAGRTPERLLGTLAEEAGAAGASGSMKQAWGNPETGIRYALSCAAIAADLASALATAHAGRIIHRDLKPSNIIIHPTGRPLVMDFGLARDEMAVGLTQSGDAVGTPSYMSPEQACGRKDLDSRVDIYGLGATLYELLALRPPFVGAHAAEIMRRIVEAEPPRLRRLNPRVPVDLETIVHRCLAKDRDQRYPSMEALELDLRAFLAGTRISSRRPGLASRAGAALARRRRGAAVAAGTAVVAALAGAVIGVVDRGSERSRGLERLEQARLYLADGDRLRAQDAYGQAAVMLADPELLADARLSHLESLFTAAYRDPGRREMLAELLDQVPSHRRDAAWHEMNRRLAGIGKVELSGVDGDTALSLYRLGDAAAPLKMDWPGDGEFAIGSYLVRAEAVGFSPVTRVFEVERDRQIALHLPRVPLLRLDPGEVLVCDDSSAWAMARTELSNADYEAIVARMPAALQQEVREGVVVDQDPKMPVRGLSWHQARAVTAHAGAHMPSLAELRFAATGGLAGRRYPWGREFDPALVAADPERLARPETVDARAGGASPFGVLNLAGNVAEITAADALRRFYLFGGHFQSGPADLDVDAPRLLSGPHAADPAAGVRLARFVDLPSEAAASVHKDVAARHDELWQSGAAVQMQDWVVGDDGAVDVRLRLAGAHVRSTAMLQIPFETPGFLQEGGALAVRVGDQPARHRDRLRSDGEASLVEVDLGGEAQRGQLFRLALARRVTALSGLRGAADAYLMEVPMRVRGLWPVVYQVTLPGAARVDAVEPRPTHHYMAGNRPVLVWEYAADRGGDRLFPAVVRFRKDGMLTGQWPTRRAAETVVDSFFGLLAADDREGLARCLAKTYVQAPASSGYLDMVSPQRRRREHFVRRSLRDVTAVGPVRTAELVVDWHVVDDSGERVVADWPLRLHWLQSGADWLMLHAGPSTGSDSGELAGDEYHYAPLGFRIVRPIDDAAGVAYSLSRTFGHIAPMQVACKPAGTDLEAAQLLVLGYRNADRSARDVVLNLLADGQLAAGSGRRIPGGGAAPSVIGAGDREHSVDVEDWLWSHDGYCREQWAILELGQRVFLFRAQAFGSTEAEAGSRFAAARPWFTAMLRCMAVDA